MIKQRVVKRGNRPHTATAPGTKPMDHCIADQTLTPRQNISISSLINLQLLDFFTLERVRRFTRWRFSITREHIAHILRFQTVERLMKFKPIQYT